MSVHPSLRLLRQGSPSALVTLEIYIDPVCPFSKRLFLAFHAHILPLIKTGRYHGRVAAIVRLQVQPWHPSSTMTVESVLAVAALSRDVDDVWDFTKQLFIKSDKFYDSFTVLESRADTYKRLKVLAQPFVKAPEFEKLLEIEPATDKDETGKNEGNKVTNLVKWSTKLGRQNGIHVTPTVLMNGIVDNEVSSSWLGKDWEAYLDKQLEAAVKPIG